PTVPQNYSGGFFFTLGSTSTALSSNLQVWSTFANGQSLIRYLPNFANTDGPPFVLRQSGDTAPAVNQTAPELSVGGTNQNVAIPNTDIGGFLSYADDLLGIQNATLNLDLDMARAAGLNVGAGLFDSLGLQNPSQFTPFLGRMFFTATNAAVGRELWSTDG